jgi:hypothetical protein
MSIVTGFVKNGLPRHRALSSPTHKNRLTLLPIAIVFQLRALEPRRHSTDSLSSFKVNHVSPVSV